MLHNRPAILTISVLNQWYTPLLGDSFALRGDSSLKLTESSPTTGEACIVPAKLYGLYAVVRLPSVPTGVIGWTATLAESGSPLLPRLVEFTSYLTILDPGCTTVDVVDALRPILILENAPNIVV